MTVVSNTGPLIGLAKVGRLDLLRDLFGEVLIPPTVQKELFGRVGLETDEIERALGQYIQKRILQAVDRETDEITRKLDAGEKEAIALASGFPKNEVLLLMDDRAGREAAKKLGIPKTGLVGLLLIAKERKAVPMVAPILHLLRNNGYWLSDALVQRAKNLAGEEE
jgi:predicted nucleic acid-binding protein